MEIKHKNTRFTSGGLSVLAKAWTLILMILIPGLVMAQLAQPIPEIPPGKKIIISFDATAASPATGRVASVQANVNYNGSVNVVSNVVALDLVTSVVSINRLDPSPAGPGSIRWTVTFEHDVSGIDDGSFSQFGLVPSGTFTTPPAITSITGSGTSYVVTANTGDGDGTATIGLNMTSDVGTAPQIASLPFVGQVYDVVFCTDPDITNVEASADDICVGSSTFLTVSGSLNDAAEWHWYTGSCGGTPAGSGASIEVRPVETTTYYVRGEGNCVGTDAECQSITIIVDEVPPLAACKNYSAVLDASGNLTLTPEMVDNGSSDNCGIASRTLSKTTFSCADIGINPVTLTVTDTKGNSNECTAMVTILNTPPTAVCKDIDVVLGPGGTVTILADAVDGGSSDECGIVSKTVSPNTFTTTDIGPNIVTLTVSDDHGGSAQCNATVNVGKRPTLLSYTGDLSGQYSDQIILSATLIDDVNGSPLVGKSISIELGTQSASATTDINGIASTTLVLNQAPGLYNLDVGFSGDMIYDEGSTTELFDLLPEDARATYTGAVYASTSSSKSSSAVVTLSATIQDITAVFGSTDVLGGDIRNADVTFIDVSNGNAQISPALPVKLINAGYPLIGNVVYEWVVDIGNADSETFEIGISVNNYYLRFDPAENTMITISKPLDNFVTGGGYILLENSAGTYAGDGDSKVNFGANVKFNKKGTNLQGKVQLLVRRTESDGLHTYRIKSNKLNSLAINNGSAEISGKANIQDVTDPNFPISVAGNQIFDLQLQDNGEPGIADLIGFTLYGNGGGLLFSSYWSGIATIPQILDGGNIVIHNKDKTSARIENLDEVANDLDEIIHSVQLSTYPNPFQNQATIEFALPYDSKATVDIYTLNGIRIKTLFNEEVKANQSYRVVFKREFFSNNIFIYRLNTDFGSYYGKLISK